MNQKEADSLKIVLRNTIDKQLKNSIIYKIITNTFNADSIKHYVRLGLENSKNTNNEWYAKYTAMGARFFYFTDKEQFYSIYKTALGIAKSKETKAYIYMTLAYRHQQGSPKDSLRFYLDKMIAQKPEDVKINIEIFYLKGTLYAANNDYNNAIPYYNKAKDLAIATGKTKGLYRYYHKLSFAFYHTGKIDLAIQTLEKALKTTIKDTYEYGRTYELMGAFTGTLNPNDSIVLVYKKLAVDAYLNGKIENELIAAGFKNLASSYLNFNQLDKALQAIRKVKAYNDISETPKSMIYQYNFLLADYFLKKQVLDSAQIYVRKVLTLTENETGRYKEYYYKSLYKLGLLAVKRNDLNLATTYFLKVANSGRYKKEISEQLYSIYKAQKKYKMSLVWLEKSAAIKDSIAQNEKEFALEKFKAQFNTKEKENELLKMTLKNEEKNILISNQRKTSLFIALISILLLLFLYLFFKVAKSKKQLKLELALEKQKEITILKRRIIENLSHEIRTPISVINGYLGLISQNSLYPTKIIKFVKIGERNINLLTESLNDFLALLKIDEQNVFPDSLKKKSLNKFFKDIAESFSANAKLKNIGLHYKSNFKDTLEVDYYYHRLEKIATNLISNAKKFTSPGKNIYIETIIHNNELKLIIKDEGKGIPKDEQEFIFERFYQSTRNNTTGGFGIGLSLVKDIVNILGGTINLKSEENIGTIFKIDLPLAFIENIDLHLKEEQPKFKVYNQVEDQRVIVGNNFPKVLIVDDNLEMTTYLLDLLSSFLDCTTANNGQVALNKLTETKFDLIISDYKMPIMDGKSLKAELNKIEAFETIPFIMLTATPVANFASLGLTLGINDYLVKPFHNNELIARIRTILENKLLQVKIQHKEQDFQLEGHVSELLDKINMLVLENLDNSKYNVSDLSNACGYGQKQFGRIIKAKTGMTAVNLVLEIRLLKAYELLLNSTYTTLKEVIYTVGLTNRSYFNKAFSKRFGIKPISLLK